MNHLLIGAADKTARLIALAHSPFLLIDDGPIADEFLAHFSRAKPFDITRHTFNPLKGMDYKRARDFAAAVYTASPQGENTLTVRNGKRALARMLLKAETLDKLPTIAHAGNDEAHETIDDVLFSPVLKRILCDRKAPADFSFKGSVIAKLDRAQLGDFDAFLLACLLIGQFQGQVIVPDGGFYLRDFHLSLIRQNRLTCSVNFLSELSPPLQAAVLSIRHKDIYRTSFDDAKRLVIYTKHTEPKNLTEQTGDDFLACF